MREAQWGEGLRAILAEERFDPRRRRQVLEAAQPKRKARLTRGLAVALALTLILGTAIAAGIRYAPLVDAQALADDALWRKYGVTQTMQVLFSRQIEENDNETTITYTGRIYLKAVLGVYTVTVRGGQAEAVWSHDGEDVAGGFAADAWGSEQLEEIMRLSEETLRERYGALPRNQEPAAANPFEQLRRDLEERGLAEPTPASQQTPLEISRRRSAEFQECWARRVISYEEAREIMWQALEQRCGLTAADMDFSDDSVAEQVNRYRMWEGRPVIAFDMYTKESPSADPSVPISDTCGSYVIRVNVETGAVEDIEFNSVYRWPIYDAI